LCHHVLVKLSDIRYKIESMTEFYKIKVQFKELLMTQWHNLIG
jgi:hypothetical protein